MANEKRLIDANALMDAFRSHMAKTYDRNKCTLEESCKTCEPGCLWRKKVSEAPTVDAVPVVHGRWEYIYGGKYANPRFRCSVCKAKALYVNVLNGLGNWIDEQDLSNYCPNCGAKMDGGNNEHT